MSVRQIFTILAAGFTLILLSACSDPKAANEGNFKKALQDYLNYEEARGEYCMGGGKYPFDTRNLRFPDPDLERIGFIKDVTPRGHWERTEFDLTDKGRQFYIVGKGFCYGKPVVVSITNFSEPSSMFGQTISEVNYEYQIEGIPAWAIEGQIKNVVRLQTTVKKKTTLILTNKGWVHNELFNKN